MRARSFFYVCAGLLMLAIAIHIKVENASAQTTPEIVVQIAAAPTSTDPRLFALTNTGQIFARDNLGDWTAIPGPVETPISVKPSTMGEVKGKYREED